MSSAMFFQLQSFLILLLMFIGIYNRKNRRRHVKLMSTAMIWDVLLILQIELTRSAIAKATTKAIDHNSLMIHLFFAVGSVILYGAMVYTGRKFLKGDEAIRPLHKKLGYLTIIFRTLTVVTSFNAVVL